jgi:hypothetical protein
MMRIMSSELNFPISINNQKRRHCFKINLICILKSMFRKEISHKENQSSSKRQETGSDSLSVHSIKLTCASGQVAFGWIQAAKLFCLSELDVIFVLCNIYTHKMACSITLTRQLCPLNVDSRHRGTNALLQEAFWSWSWFNLKWQSYETNATQKCTLLGLKLKTR